MRTDQKIAIGLLAFIAVMGYFTTQLPETIMETEPGPKFFPALILATMAILSIVLYFGKETKSEVTRIKTESLRLDPAIPAFGSMTFFGAFFCGLVLMKFVGFIISMTITLMVMLTMAKWKFFPKAVIFSILVVVVIYLVFERLLDIPLPTGTLVEF